MPIISRIYYAEHGDLKILKLYTTPGGLSLGVWLVTQCRVREGQIQGNLTEQQIARLDSMGMRWEKVDSRPHRLEMAQGSKRESENLNVSANHKTGEDVGLCG